MRMPLMLFGLALMIAGCGGSQVVDGDEARVTVRSFEFHSGSPDAAAGEHCAQFDRRAKLVDTEPDSFARVLFLYDCKS